MTNRQVWNMLQSVLRKADAHKKRILRTNNSFGDCLAHYDTYTDMDSLEAHIKKLKFSLGPLGPAKKKKRAGTQ